MFIYVPIFYKKKKSTPFKEKLLQLISYCQ
jgi:hypothetical protein